MSIFLGANTPTPLYRFWQSQFEYSESTTTVIFSAYMAGLVLALTVAGRLADRYGRRGVLLPGIGFAALSAVVFLTAGGVPALVAARFLSGLAVGAAITAGVAATVDLSPAGRRSLASLLGSGAMVLGAGLGPLIAGVIAVLTDSPVVASFAIVLVTVSCGGAIVALLPLRRPVDTVPRASGAIFAWPRVPRVNRRHLIWGILAFAPGLCCTAFVLSLGASTLAESTGREEPLLAGASACLMFLVSTIVQFVCARLTRKRQLLASALATCGCMVALLVFVHGVPWPGIFMGVAVLAGIGQGLGQLAGITLIAENVAESRRAEANAALSIAAYLAAGALILATGTLIGVAGLGSAITSFTAVIIAAAMFGAIVVSITYSGRVATQHPEINRSQGAPPR